MTMKLRSALILPFLLGAALLPSVSAAKGISIHTAPPGEPFKPVSKLTGLPDFLPGMGSLYVDPATLPAGPFLGYDRHKKLVNVIYMLPLKALDEHKPFAPLGEAVKGLKVDHTDVEFNPGHAGVPEPHYHVTLWLIGHTDHEKRMK
jgi:hypothetical protein